MHGAPRQAQSAKAVHADCLSSSTSQSSAHFLPEYDRPLPPNAPFSDAFALSAAIACAAARVSVGLRRERACAPGRQTARARASAAERTSNVRAVRRACRRREPPQARRDASAEQRSAAACAAARGARLGLLLLLGKEGKVVWRAGTTSRRVSAPHARRLHAKASWKSAGHVRSAAHAPSS